MILEIAKPVITGVMEASKKFIGEYLAKSIELLKDDALFFKEIKGFMRSIPH